jgi:hypothetical protein
VEMVVKSMVIVGGRLFGGVEAGMLRMWCCFREMLGEGHGLYMGVSVSPLRQTSIASILRALQL